MAKVVVAAVFLQILLLVTHFYVTESQVCGWTEWMDNENGGTVDPAGQGEFEIIQVLRNSYNICQENITDIECREVNSPNRPYNETGQIGVTCTTDLGLGCFHDKQEPAGTKCLNYEIRLLCGDLCDTNTASNEGDTTETLTESSSTTTSMTTLDEDTHTTGISSTSDSLGSTQNSDVTTARSTTKESTTKSRNKPTPILESPPYAARKKSSKANAIVIGVSVGSAFLLVCFIIYVACIKRQKVN
ncbi:uncharacterized protein LOC144435800 [Glandiceps talaboti]